MFIDNKRCFTTLAFVLFCLPMMNIQASSEFCPSPHSPNDIILCLQEQHPEIVGDHDIRLVTEKLVAQGDSFKNPEASFETIGGTNLDGSVYESEFRLSQTIELGSRRSAQKKSAFAQGDLFTAEGLEKKEQVTLQGVLALYRILQIKDELVKLEESIEKFKSAKRQYLTRPKLSPEQETSLSIISMAISEFEIKRNQTEIERRSLISDLATNTKFTSSVIESNLPKHINSWPAIPQVEIQSRPSSLLKAEANAAISSAELAKARADAWPEVTLSAIAQNRIEGSFQYQLFGAGITLPLPFYQQNQGEKSLKKVEFARAEKLLTATQAKLKSTLSNAIQTYQSSVQNLKSTPSNDEIERKHNSADRLFNQGMILGSLMIESHRQILEYTIARNQEELKAMESLWSIYILNGTFLTKTIF